VPIRLAAPLALVALSALLAGCGGSSPDEPASTATAPVGAAAKSCETKAVDAEGLRAAGVSCGQARQVMYGWQQRSSCSAPAGASRVSCTSHSYRCLGARTDRGIAVSCARPGRSIAFIAPRG
jgi:hypothetical protein